MFDTNNLEQILQKIESHGWAVGSISPTFYNKLLARSIEIEKAGLFKPAQITQGSENSNSNNSIRNDFTYWIEKEHHTTETELHNFLNEVMENLKNYFRISLTHFESHFALYPEGHYYKKHVDQTANNNKRFFSFVIYLNEHWNESLGGKLVGYNNNSPVFSILPSGGQMIIFRSDIPHEVEPSRQTRRSIAGWFRT